jgi:hypothetical protein
MKKFQELLKQKNFNQIKESILNDSIDLDLGYIKGIPYIKNKEIENILKEKIKNIEERIIALYSLYVINKKYETYKLTIKIILEKELKRMNTIQETLLIKLILEGNEEVLNEYFDIKGKN